MTSSVLILGARGRFGSAAARAFLAAGWDVLGQIRPGSTGDIAGLRYLNLDANDTAALAQAARGAQVVVHGLNVTYTQWHSEVPRMMDCAIRVAKALDATLLFPGNVYNYGAGMPALLSETTPQLPSARKGQLRLQVEQALAASDVRSVIIRAGDFFGSGTGSWFDLALAKDLSKGKVTLPGVLNVPTPWAYLPDLARVFVAVANKLQAEPQALPLHSSFCFPGHALSGQNWIDLLEPIAREHAWLKPGATLKVGYMPWGLFKALSFVVPLFRELAEMQYLGRTPHELSGARLQAFLGKIPTTPLPQAVRTALAELGKT